MRNRTGLIVATVLLGVCVVRADELRDRLQASTQATGTNYLSMRNGIVALGTNELPDLRRLADSTNESWQVRLMAGICAERIEKGSDIRAMIERNWNLDPEYKSIWDKVCGGVGSVASFGVLVGKRYKEKELWYYYIETIWKETEEHSHWRPVRPDMWLFAARQGLLGSRVFDLLSQVLAERIRGDSGFRSYETGLEFIYLTECGTNSVLPIVLELMSKVPLTEDQRWTEMHRVVKTMAQPSDVPLIEKYYADLGQGIPGPVGTALRVLREKSKVTNAVPRVQGQ